MIQLEIEVIGAQAIVRKVGELTTGMVGAVARFSFDSVWDGLTKVAVFRGSGVVRDVLEWDGDSVRIPAEVLRQVARLFVGVEGRDSDGLVVIPTTWTEEVWIEEGANASGDPSTDPEDPVWAQIQRMIGDLSELGTTDRDSLVAAINEVLRSGGGAVDEAAVARIVEAYLQEHPVRTDTTLTLEGVAADAKETGTNIRNIGKTLNAIEKVSRFMTTSEWVLSIDSVAKTVTVPSGMLACGTWCLPVAEQTVDIVQDDATTLVVYDSADDAVKSVLFSAYTGKTMYVIAVITAERYTEPNANWVQGPYLVDGVPVGSGSDATGDEKWESISDISLTEAVSDLSQTWVDTPMRKIRIDLITVAAETATNYMSVSIATNNSGSFDLNAGRFYATPLPTTSAQNYEYFAEVFKLGDDVAVRFTESSGGIVPKGTTSVWRGIINSNIGVKSAVSLGNGLYGRVLSEQITGVNIHSYGTFAEGTKMTIWGVRL